METNTAKVSAPKFCCMLAPNYGFIDEKLYFVSRSFTWSYCMDYGNQE